MMRIILLLAVFLIHSVTPDPPTCWAVKKAVAQYGESAVEAWARSKGISEKEIEKAKRCLR
jgi:hypothetical protein